MLLERNPRLSCVGMPPPISHSPWRACANYPFCSAAQCQPRDAQGHKTRAEYCQQCLRIGYCSVMGCSRRRVPTTVSASPLCMSHADRTFMSTAWTLCANSVQHGCKHFSRQNDAGLCFACHNQSLPCCNAAHGCDNHDRNNVDGSRSCATRSGGAQKECPAQPPWCERCREHRVETMASKLCKICNSGCVPCLRHCGKRAVPKNGQYCTSCRPLRSKKRKAGKTLSAAVEIEVRPLKPSRLCVYAPACTRSDIVSASTGRCSVCILHSTPPCLHASVCGGRSLPHNYKCHSCNLHGPPCKGTQGLACKYQRRAKIFNKGFCYKCRHPPCPGVGFALVQSKI